MNFCKFLSVLIIWALFQSALVAQDTTSVAIKAIQNQGEIVIRWAPLNYASWKSGNLEGYSLNRYVYAVNGQINTLSAYIASKVELGPFSVAPEAEWAQPALTNELFGLAASCIYGDSLEVLPIGGASLENVYNKSKESETRFGWSLLAADQNLQIAQMMGLAYVDEDIGNNIEYVYELITNVLPNDTAYTRVLYTNEDTAVPKPIKVGFEPLDHGVLLHWKPDEATYTSFDIERSENNGQTFQKVNASPIIFTSNAYTKPNAEATFFDSLANNTTIYIYRIKGRNIFGMISPPSDTMRVKGKPDKMNVLWHIDEITETETSVQVKWVFPAALQNQINGFEIWRGTNQEGPFVKISSTLLATNVRTFVDNNPLVANYYVVKTKDVNNYQYETFARLGQPKDHTPPLAPTAVQGECTPDGRVKISWHKSSSSDVMGYRVFFSNLETDEYFQITSVWIQDTFFYWQTTMNTLSEEIWFGVKALDYRQNQSTMSQVTRVTRPDIIPPSPPIIKKVNAFASGVRFGFTMSGSKDVASYRFERKRQNIPGWTALTTFPASAPAYDYYDTSGDKRKVYDYRLLAIDDAGLVASSEIVKAQRIDDGLRHPIQNLVAQVLNDSKVVTLRWDYTYDEDVIGFEIYRAVQDSNKQRSYAFLPFPQVKNTNPGYEGTLIVNGNNIQGGFSDYDVKFDAPQLNNFQFFVTPGMTTNQAIPGQTQSGATVGTFTVPNPNNMNGQSTSQPYKLYYWVVARYADGGASPIAGWVMVVMN